MNFFLAIASTTDSSDDTLVESSAKQLNALERWWQSLDWEAIFGVIIQKAVMLLFISLLFVILYRAAHFLVERSFRSYTKKSKNNNETRLNTLHRLTRNIVQYTLGFFFIYALLSVIGVPVGSLLAGAGIAGVAIGLGAQGFMSDLITGFFIITEQQMNVGDYIRLTNLGIEGTVTLVGLRTVQLQSSDGTVHFIPNRNITTISNTSRADMRVLVEVRIVPAEGIDGITQAIERANQKVLASYPELIRVPPVIFGLVDLGNGHYAIRTTMYVVNGNQWKMQEELLSASIEELTKAGYTIPKPGLTTI